MSETEKCKRNLWQVHLSTVLFAMFIAAGCMYFNFSYRPEVFGRPKTYDGGGKPIEVRLYHVRGWPFMSWKEEIATPPTVASKIIWIDGEELLFGQVFNIPFCIFVTTLIACCFEWLVRRREARKPQARVND